MSLQHMYFLKTNSQWLSFYLRFLVIQYFVCFLHRIFFFVFLFSESINVFAHKSCWKTGFFGLLYLHRIKFCAHLLNKVVTATLISGNHSKNQYFTVTFGIIRLRNSAGITHYVW